MSDFTAASMTQLEKGRAYGWKRKHEQVGKGRVEEDGVDLI